MCHDFEIKDQKFGYKNGMNVEKAVSWSVSGWDCRSNPRLLALKTSALLA